MTKHFKIKYVLIGIFSVLLLHFFQQNFHSAAFQTKSFEEKKTAAVKKIPAFFLKNLDRLSREKQGHFLVRLYRLSGDPVYLPGIRAYGDQLVRRIKNHAANLHSEEHVTQTAAHFLKLPEKPLIKHRYRVKTRSAWPEMAVAHRLLFLAFQTKSFGLHESIADDFGRILKFLSELSYEPYLLNEDVIRYNATRTVNMVYQLQFLELGNYEAVFLDKLKKVFFSQPDASLDRTVYLNKMYGLTHWIIAASDFYQHPVPYDKFKWVLDYFEENIDTILIRNSPDAIAEVAVCFKLAGRADHPAVKKIQEFLLQKFDARRGFIPSDRKEFTLDGIEHRNILAYMALSDWKQLYPGPDLNA